MLPISYLYSHALVNLKKWICCMSYYTTNKYLELELLTNLKMASRGPQYASSNCLKLEPVGV